MNTLDRARIAVLDASTNLSLVRKLPNPTKAQFDYATGNYLVALDRLYDTQIVYRHTVQL